MTGWLTTLTHAPAPAVKAFAEGLLDSVGTVRVIENRTGLVMLPYTDSAGGATFHLGEALVSEALVAIAAGEGAQGYALVTGRDLVFALAIAIIDAAARAGLESERIAAFVAELAQTQADADQALLRVVETTRVEMETF